MADAGGVLGGAASGAATGAALGPWGALAGGVIGGIGSLFGASSKNKAAEEAAAAARFNPYNVYGPGGQAMIGKDPTTGALSVQQQLGARQQDLYNQFLTGAGQNIFGQNYGSQMAGGWQQQGGDQISRLFGAMQNQQYQTPDQATRLASQFGNLGSYAQQGASQGLFNAYNGPSAMGGANFAQQQGAAMAGQSFNDLAAQRLGALRQQAIPMNEQTTNAKFNSLFSRGQLGTSGGAQALGQLQQAQNQQDLGFQTSAMDFAQGQYNNQQQLAQGWMGQGLQGIGQQQNYGLAQGQLGMQGFGMAGQQYGAQLGAYQAADQAALSRGQNRLTAAQGLFGFGGDVKNQALQQGLQQLGGAQSFESGLLQQAQLGASVGQAQSSANANAGTLAMKGAGSPFGAALQGIGTGIANSSGFEGWLGGLFGKKEGG